MNLQVKGLIFATIIGIGFGGYQFKLARDAQSTSARLRLERDRLTQDLSTARKQASEAETSIARLRQENFGLKLDFDSIFSKQVSVKAPVAADPKLVRGQTRKVYFDNPFRGARWLLETTCQSLYRRLDFSDVQIEQFKALAIEAESRFADLDETAVAQRLKRSDPILSPLYREVDESIREKAVAYFGESGLAAIERFGETLILREIIAQVAEVLFYTNTPISQSQAENLVDIMWKNMRDPSGRMDPTFADAQPMLDDAQRILSSPQFSVWREFIQQLRKNSFSTLKTQRTGASVGQRSP